MITEIILTFWITCAIVYVLKDAARPFSSSRSFLILFNIFSSPYLLFSDIKDEWDELKELRNRYKD